MYSREYNTYRQQQQRPKPQSYSGQSAYGQNPDIYDRLAATSALRHVGRGRTDADVHAMSAINGTPSMIGAAPRRQVEENLTQLQKDLEKIQKIQAQTGRFDTVRALVNCKMEEGGDVSNHVLKMMNHLVHLERLGYKFPKDVDVDLILLSLPESYDSFVMMYNMNGWEKTLPELFNLLTTFEKSIPKKTSPVLMIREGGIKKPKHIKKKAWLKKKKKKKAKKGSAGV